jgi:predicted XRE-type DNA-binding protein
MAKAKRKQTTPQAIRVTRGSGNVYADLGFANPEEELAKAQLAMMIDDAIRERGLTQHAAAKLMGIDQPKVSHIRHGRLGGFSLERLLDFLTTLGRDIDIVVKPSKSRKHGRLRIEAA